MKAQAALIALRDAIYAALEAISSGFLSRPVSEPKKAELDLDGLSEGQLMAMRINLDAEKLEYERALTRGQLRVVYDMADEIGEKDAIHKSLLLAIPGRLAAQMEHATIEQARALISTEIEQALAVLTTRQ